jgi:hypothetical protein
VYGGDPTGEINTNPDGIENVGGVYGAEVEIINLNDQSVLDSFPVARNTFVQFFLRPLKIENMQLVTKLGEQSYDGFECGLDVYQHNNYVVRSVDQHLKSMSFVCVDQYKVGNSRKAAVHLRSKGSVIRASTAYETEFDFSDVNSVTYDGVQSQLGGNYVVVSDPSPHVLNALYQLTLYNSSWYNTLADHPNGSLACYAKARWTIDQGVIANLDQVIDYVRLPNAGGGFLETTHRQLLQKAAKARCDELETLILELESEIMVLKAKLADPELPCHMRLLLSHQLEVAEQKLEEAESALVFYTPLKTKEESDYTSGGFYGHSYFDGGGDPEQVAWRFSDLLKGSKLAV